MNRYELAQLVAEIRRVGLACFLTKSGDNRENPKLLESGIDRAVPKVLGQPSLFPEAASLPEEKDPHT